MTSAARRRHGGDGSVAWKVFLVIWIIKCVACEPRLSFHYLSEGELKKQRVDCSYSGPQYDLKLIQLTQCLRLRRKIRIIYNQKSKNNQSVQIDTLVSPLSGGINASLHDDEMGVQFTQLCDIDDTEYEYECRVKVHERRDLVIKTNFKPAAPTLPPKETTQKPNRVTLPDVKTTENGPDVKSTEKGPDVKTTETNKPPVTESDDLSTTSAIITTTQSTPWRPIILVNVILAPIIIIAGIYLYVTRSKKKACCRRGDSESIERPRKSRGRRQSSQSKRSGQSKGSKQSKGSNGSKQSTGSSQSEGSPQRKGSGNVYKRLQGFFRRKRSTRRTSSSYSSSSSSTSSSSY